MNSTELESRRPDRWPPRPPAGAVPPGGLQLLQGILAHSTAVIYVKDPRGRYLLVNGRFEELFGVSQTEIVGRTDYDLFPPGRVDVLRANDVEVLTTGRPVEFEEVVPHGGEDRTYISLKFPITDPDGVPYAVCGISTDITDRKRAERYLAVQLAVTRALAEVTAQADPGIEVLRAVCETLAWDVGLLWKVDAAGGPPRCAGYWSAGGPGFAGLDRDLRLSEAVGLAGRVWAEARPVWVPDLAAAGLSTRAAARAGITGACGFPVRGTGRAVRGVLEFFTRGGRHPDPGLADVMAGVGSQLEQFVERRQADLSLHAREQEFRVARQIQQWLLPQDEPALPGFSVAGVSLPARETGGDYLDFVPMPDGSLGVAVGDASGHGIGAALVMTETRAYLRARATTDADPGRILTGVNRHLARDLPGGMFITLFFAQIRAPDRTLVYSSAGHCTGYVLDPAGRVRVLLPSTSMPLGIDPTAPSVTAPPVPLNPGEVVLVLTDGILEATSPDDGTMFGAERALAVVRSRRAAPPAEILAALVQGIRSFTWDTQADDMTAAVIRVG